MLGKDSKGISELPLMEHILPYNISCIRGSSETLILSLTERETDTEFQYTTKDRQHNTHRLDSKSIVKVIILSLRIILPPPLLSQILSVPTVVSIYLLSM